MRGDGRSGGARLAALALAVAVGAPAAAAPPARPPSSANPDVGPLDAASLARAAHGTRLVLPMPDGARVALSVERRRRPGPGRVTLSGPVVGSPAGRFVLAVNGSAVAGVVRLGVAGTFQVGGSGAALRVDRVDAGGLAPCGGATDCGAPPAGGVAGDDDGCEDGSVIDVLVLFTTTARIAAGTLAAIEAEIDMMMEDANVALASSDVPSELRLVLAWEVTIDESMLNVTALINAADGVLDGVHLLRDAYAADLVAVVRSGAGGVAAGLDSLDPANEAFAFSISGLASAPTLVLAHEIGHNLGACHAIGDGGGCDEDGGLLFPFSNGHRFTGDSGAAYRTVMAYAPGERIGHYSNPDVTVDGQPTGVPEGDPAQADNASTIVAASGLVASYRCADETCRALDLPGSAPDCNDNGVPDGCDLALGLAPDVDQDGAVDSCECGPDVTGDRRVDAADVGAIIAAWGQVGVPADATHDGMVDVDDLLAVIVAWGDCATGPQVPPAP
ncbi:MAG: zinc-dependent metalloprotease family protein [Planctomycetota bacterium]|jgi:hypothetical protein